MDSLISNFIFNNWQQKILALFSAFVIWFVVSSSITSTRTIPSIPIRIINLPPNKTIIGLMPNGFLVRRIALTISGTKDVIDSLESSDLEVVLDASNQPNEWIVQITKKNVVSLIPDVDLLHHITNVSHPEFVINLSPYITEKIPLKILPPKGSPPEGYHYLDIWPMELSQTVSGPEEQVLSLKNKGLELTFDLNLITAEELEAIKNPDQNYQDEISYLVPEKWKKIGIPFKNNILEPLNDPLAKYLQIDFLKKRLHQIPSEIPIRVFFPLKYIEMMNPNTLSLEENQLISEKEGVFIFNPNLFTKNVSSLFLDVVNEYIELTIAAAPKNEREILEWSTQFIDPRDLEDTYVAYHMNFYAGPKQETEHPKLRENHLRKRFRDYIQNFKLYTSENQKLELLSEIQDSKIIVKEMPQD